MSSGQNKNTSLALSLAAIVAGMLMLAYASVPLYRLFCQATGFGGIARKTESVPGEVLARTVTVHFDANSSMELNWSFKPAMDNVTVKLGEQKQIDYIAENLNDVPSTGSAMFNVTPTKAGGYFDKIQCFCFSKQTLKPHEKRRMGVTFFIDPQMAKNPDLNDVRTMTLSYTFFPAK